MKELQVSDPMAPNLGAGSPGVDLHNDDKEKNGSVFAYADDIQMGIIKTVDEQRFVFVKSDWLHPESLPKAGIVVTFEAAGPLARKIKIADSVPSP